MNELSKGKSKVKTVEKLSSKIRNEFGETVEEKKKIEQLRTIEQEKRTCDKYVQVFKKMAWENSYKRQPLIKEFKRKLSSKRVQKKITH